MLRAAIFDMGNVLIDWDPRVVYRPHFASENELEIFMNGLFARMQQAIHATDLAMADALAPLKTVYPDDVVLIELFERGWFDFLRGPMAQSLAVVDALAAQKVPLYGLTNWPRPVWPPLCSRGVHDYGFLALFDDILVSGQEALAKPDPAIFERALARFELEPREVVFIDDLPVNVEAAEALGMTGHRFVSADHLETDLVRLGLLSKDVPAR